MCSTGSARSSWASAATGSSRRTRSSPPGSPASGRCRSARTASTSPIRLIDFDDLEQNQYVVTTQFTFRAGATEKRADLVLLVNGIPLVVIEAKTPVRASQSWLDGALQVHDDYERNVPELFVPNVFSVATEGKEFRYGSIGLPVELWGPWRIEADDGRCRRCSRSSRRSPRCCGRTSCSTCWPTSRPTRRTRRSAGSRSSPASSSSRARTRSSSASSPASPKKGLIWHFQGSGKSLLMLFAARKLRLHPALKNPTVMIVVDRIDLDSQISSTFYAADMPNLVKADSRSELQRLLAQDVRKIIITTILKFGEADGVLNDREQHHRDGRRGAPHAGGRPRPQDARGAAERVPVRADRHADQPRRPQHLLRLRRRGGRGRLHEPLRLRGVDPRRRDDAAALRAAAARAAHRPGGDRRGLQGAHRRPRATSTGTRLGQGRREDGRARQGPGAHRRRSAPTSPATSRRRSRRTASARRS